MFPRRPSVVNLLVNDICNSKCQMCHIWGRKRDREITPAELSEILSDRLFEAVKYVGVSGGEPTLRKDLVELYRSIVNRRPRIEGTGIITNAIRSDDVLIKLNDSFNVCRDAGVSFNVMVSLDGIGPVHDLVRGRRGNFQNVLKVIESLKKNSDLPVSIGCTVTKDNVWQVDEVLDWCREEGIYGRFRVAEFISRLYNEDQSEYIRNFTDDEAYHLGLFFAKLEHQYETSQTIKRTYRNIRKMLMEGASRSIKCPWQSNGVTLDCRGQLSYCAPRSPILGSCLSESPNKLYFGNILKRKDIVRNDCDDCIHDYHAEETFAERINLYTDERWQRRLSLQNALKAASASSGSPANPAQMDPPGTCLIVGWYGTETAGDKAILAELVYRIRQRNAEAKIVLASLFPYVSQRTIKELQLENVDVVATYGQEFWHWTESADEIVMGGGPLMHIDQLGAVLWAFLRGKRAGARTVIAGCGIGPLTRGGAYGEAVGWLLRLADVVELRDSHSVAAAEDMSGRDDIENTGDPAINFVRRWKQHKQTFASGTPSQPVLNLFLREWTTEYLGDQDSASFLRLKLAFEAELGKWIAQLCGSLELRPRLLPMHHFCVGNDDRDFNRRFASRYLAGLDPVVERRPVSVDYILTNMMQGKLNMCMRFHSVAFAHTLGAPFIAVDYTSGGKIRGFLSDLGELERMIDLRDVAAGRWRSFDNDCVSLHSE